ncbi:hypothetical protein COCVIDRAFT_108815 [Bipolaris victoriae FI3]|uniref:Uncharacterized protein n=1 Tax=Bipolaris victoriae (strain FI3) TaxID=930091 RepID=W7DZG0_BIPV3|nr:hypothetical protein COCVIDRAFT_108815 [Bipolaris victoriae FI3]
MERQRNTEYCPTRSNVGYIYRWGLGGVTMVGIKLTGRTSNTVVSTWFSKTETAFSRLLVRYYNTARLGGGWNTISLGLAVPTLLRSGLRYVHGR